MKQDPINVYESFEGITHISCQFNDSINKAQCVLYEARRKIPRDIASQFHLSKVARVTDVDRIILDEPTSFRYTDVSTELKNIPTFVFSPRATCKRGSIEGLTILYCNKSKKMK